MTEIRPYLDRLCARFAEPGIQQSFQGFNQTLLFIFTDSVQRYAIAVADGVATLREGDDPGAAIKVTTTTDTLAGILDKKTNPITAYMTRKIQVAGPMDEMLKLQKLMS